METEPNTVAFDFKAHLQRQRDFSEKTFGPGPRTAGVCDHIRKELDEITAKPDDIEEWIDVVILALDGAWRAGATPQQIIDTIVAKQTKNEARTWPDWRTADPDKAITHVKADGASAPEPTPHPVTTLTERIHKQADNELDQYLHERFDPLYAECRSHHISGERMEAAICPGTGLRINSQVAAVTIIGMGHRAAKEALRQKFRDRKVAEFMQQVESLSYALEYGEVHHG